MLKMMMKIGTDLEREGKKKIEIIRKATETALKREGFLLAADLRKDIKAGRSGSQSFDSLAMMAQRRGMRLMRRKPYTKLESTEKAGGASKGIIPIRYNPVTKGDKFAVEVGMVDTRQEKISKSWIRIFEKQQEGFTQTVTQKQRKWLATMGGELPKRSKLRKYYFLRKTTTTLRTPGRPVIDPFYERWRVMSPKRIEENIERKLRGERI